MLAAMNIYHTPVMLNECLEGLKITSSGTFVDLTFGGGGHSGAILERLDTGKLFAFDQDPDAAENAKSFVDKSFNFIPSNFQYFKRYLKLHGFETVDGILADLGVSSHQIDTPHRGFSTRFDAELDMRMDKTSPKTAKTVVNEYSQSELQQILSQYGEVRNARQLSEAIARARSSSSINTIEDLKSILNPLARRNQEFKYQAQVFQAIRIEVNNELEVLKEMLVQAAEALNVGGRLVVISYHSLEDRLVKNFFNTGNFKGEQEKDLYGNVIRPLQPITKKPLVPHEEELQFNKRSRSAKLRIAEKL